MSGGIYVIGLSVGEVHVEGERGSVLSLLGFAKNAAAITAMISYKKRLL